MRSFSDYWKDFREGQLSRKDASDFVELLNSARGKEVFYQAVEDAFANSEADGSRFDEWDEEEQLKRVLEKKRSTPPEQRFFKFPSSAWYKGVAATVALFAVALFSYLLVAESHDSQTLSEVDQLAPVILTKFNPKGVKTKIHLPDNSVVYLNADSYLSYEKNFRDGRLVRLVGEAFFEVAKDSLRPFQVLTGRLATTALGTSFNIKAYSEVSNIQVTLSTGKVSVEDQVSTEKLILEPGEALRLIGLNEKLGKMQTDPKAASSWKEGILQFEKTPMSEVVLLLERWYGVSFKGPEKWPDVKCSGSFRKNEYLSNVLKVLSHSVGFSYSIEEKTVIINFNKP